MTGGRNNGDHAIATTEPRTPTDAETASGMAGVTVSRQGVKRLRLVGAVSFWTLTVVGVVGFVVLVAVSGWSEMRQNWGAGEPWFSGFQAASLAIPIAALIAAGVAITTARWGLHSARETRDADQKRWKEERDADQTRWRDERDADRTRWEADRAVERERRKTERRDATERTLRDRFHELIKLLSAEELRAREGAAYAVAALADDWKTHYDRHNPIRAHAEQQVCINVLIAQLHDPLPDGAEDASYAQLIAFKHAIQNIISSRLGRVDSSEARPGVWSSFNFTFDGCTFHNLKLDGCIFDASPVSFRGARFTGDTVFNGASFAGEAWFDGARFDGEAWFNAACFAGDAMFGEASFDGKAWFFGASFDGGAWFRGAGFAGDAWFNGAQFAVDVMFFGAHFAEDAVFRGAHFARVVMFSNTRFTGLALFDGAHFTGRAAFGGAHFARLALFDGAHFTGLALFDGAHFAAKAEFDDTHFAGTRESLEDAQFEGDPVQLDNTYFNVSPADFPECEVCDKLRARQEAAREPDRRSPELS